MNPYKDANDRWLTQGLFWETATDRKKYTPSFTTKEEDMDKDGVTYRSLKKIYMDMADPTEYNFAMQTFGSYKCWEKLTKAAFFQDYLEEWRRELTLKLMAEGVQATRELAAKGNAGAAKELMNKGWKEDKKSRGRPSKEEKAGVLKNYIKETAEVDSDYERLIN